MHKVQLEGKEIVICFRYKLKSCNDETKSCFEDQEVLNIISFQGPNCRAMIQNLRNHRIAHDGDFQHINF